MIHGLCGEAGEMSDFFWFSDAQWERIAPLLPTDVRGKKRVDDRRVLSGIVHALRCGGRWVDCADVYGPKKTLYNRFVRWSERGIWEGVFSALAGAADAPDRLFIDSSCIKVHRCAGGGKGGPWLMVSAAPKAGATPSSMPSATRKAALSSCS
jgi:transposase